MIEWLIQNKDSISLILSIFSSVSIVIGWIVTYWKNRINIELEITGLEIISKDRYVLRLNLINNSKSPLVITDIVYSVGNSVFNSDISFMPFMFPALHGKELNIPNTQPPLNISPTTGVSFYTQIVFLEQSHLLPANKATLLVRSNRSRSVEFEFELDKIPQIYSQFQK
ncbi:hypothetical protein [Erysipelothrix aquatica]|uniref:hypothetical protein n=1 Tax=Erysipelothrix aquatica TaxID=2683714 RepID=UPI00135A5AC7|nr:hypothetical protein [Erysipelothrix aquatica]